VAVLYCVSYAARTLFPSARTRYKRSVIVRPRSRDVDRRQRKICRKSDRAHVQPTATSHFWISFFCDERKMQRPAPPWSRTSCDVHGASSAQASVEAYSLHEVNNGCGRVSAVPRAKVREMRSSGGKDDSYIALGRGRLFGSPRNNYPHEFYCCWAARYRCPR
jgi:hypothetical protein